MAIKVSKAIKVIGYFNTSTDTQLVKAFSTWIYAFKPSPITKEMVRLSHSLREDVGGLLYVSMKVRINITSLKNNKNYEECEHM